MNVVAILETMWDWRQMTSGAGYRQAPQFFRISPENFSGRRLYKLIGPGAKLLVTNACKELVSGPKQHGTPDPEWLAANLAEIESRRSDSAAIDVLLVCGKVAQKTYQACGYKLRSQTARVVEMPHPAARVWTKDVIASFSKLIQEGCDGKNTERLDSA